MNEGGNGKNEMRKRVENDEKDKWTTILITFSFSRGINIVRSSQTVVTWREINVLMKVIITCNDNYCHEC